MAVQLAEYRSQLRAAGLGQYADSVTDAAFPSIRLLADSQIDATTAGASRLGLLPDLTAGLPWPANQDGTPLSVVAQLDLGEIATYRMEGILPRSGLLSFFYRPLLKAHEDSILRITVPGP
jgi:uncharacterized protein YwqG